MTSTSRGTLLLVVALAGSVAVVMHQQQRIELQMAAVTQQLDVLVKQLAKPSLTPRPMTPPPVPVDADAVAARVAHLMNVPASGSPVAAAAAAAPSANEPPQEPTHAAETALAIIAAALDRGQLATDDVKKLRVELANARPEERQEIARRIAVGLNTGKLTPQDPHDIFP